MAKRIWYGGAELGILQNLHSSFIVTTSTEALTPSTVALLPHEAHHIDRTRERLWLLSFWTLPNPSIPVSHTRLVPKQKVSSGSMNFFHARIHKASITLHQLYLCLSRSRAAESWSRPYLPWTSLFWKSPLPLKIKIFVWQLLMDHLPSG
jgi:hypothetical protein